jgi:hypothetical protein
MGLKREIVRGRPIVVGEHEIVPEAAVWTWEKKDVVIRDEPRITGFGLRLAWVQPTALYDRRGDKTYRLPIIDHNRRLELSLLIAALLLPIVLNAAVTLLRQGQTQAST